MRDRLLTTTLLICGVLGAPVVLLLGPAMAQIGAGNLTGRSYYIPSESMEPTLTIGDRISPRTVAPSDFRRGMVVVFMLGSEARVARIVGLAGDIVQMRDGEVVLNGTPVMRIADGDGPATRDGFPTRRFVEQFPGEPAPHRILDEGPQPQDNTERLTVPAGHVFLLGDNRDNAADSRFPRADSGAPMTTGAGFVPVGTVTGSVDFVTWSTGRWRIGRAIDDPGPDKLFTWL